MRDENYMVRDGEQLVHQVGVRSPIVEEDAGMGAYAAEAVSSMDHAGAGSSNAEPPNLQDEGAEDRPGGMEEDNQGDKSHIDAEEFASSPLGQKFYAEWKQGKVSPALIGQRFGYHVLGKFASLLEDEKEALENANADSVAHAVLALCCDRLLRKPWSWKIPWRWRKKKGMLWHRRWRLLKKWAALWMEWTLGRPVLRCLREVCAPRVHLRGVLKEQVDPSKLALISGCCKVVAPGNCGCVTAAKASWIALGAV